MYSDEDIEMLRSQDGKKVVLCTVSEDGSVFGYEGLLSFPTVDGKEALYLEGHHRNIMIKDWVNELKRD